MVWVSQESLWESPGQSFGESCPPPPSPVLSHTWAVSPGLAPAARWDLVFLLPKVLTRPVLQMLGPRQPDTMVPACTPAKWLFFPTVCLAEGPPSPAVVWKPGKIDKVHPKLAERASAAGTPQGHTWSPLQETPQEQVPQQHRGSCYGGEAQSQLLVSPA